jgi:hypothetical protein
MPATPRIVSRHPPARTGILPDGAFFGSSDVYGEKEKWLTAKIAKDAKKKTLKAGEFASSNILAWIFTVEEFRCFATFGPCSRPEIREKRRHSEENAVPISADCTKDVAPACGRAALD